MNPVRAGMVSHQQYLSLAATDEDRRLAYRQQFKAITPEEDLIEIRDATTKAWALGSERFAAEIEELIGRARFII
jgi:putative transposase